MIEWYFSLAPVEKIYFTSVSIYIVLLITFGYVVVREIFMLPIRLKQLHKYITNNNKGNE